MKHMKKLASLLLALVMVMGLATTAFAAPETGTITIDNAVVDQTYTVYQILDLESYNVDNTTTGDGQYAYKATSDWSSFINSDAIKGTYVDVDSQGYVTWVNGASAADFAKKAKEYADKNNITPGYYENYDKENVKFVEVEPVIATSTTVEFNGLDLGYYLVDSTMGTLCSLDTTNPNVTIKEKNVAPGNEKKVEEGGNYGSSNDANIGDTVYFQSTITAQAGAENYVFHDKMSAGLTFGSVTGVTLNGTAVAASNYEVKTSELGDDCTFHVVFTQAFCDTLKANNQIVISYTATVNEKAVAGNDGNKNESKIEYGEAGKTTTTPPSETITYTWDVDVFKYTKDGETEKPLADARFTLSKSSDGTNPIKLINKGNNVYRVAKNDEKETVTEITTDSTGRFTIEGLDSDTYYLTETAAPAGYNKLAGPITIVIGENGVVNGTTDATQGAHEVKVLNQTGTELPSTGGMGTTIFYVIGGILVVVAGVLLITKKRMSAEK